MDPELVWYSSNSISAIHHVLRSSRRRLAVIIVATRMLGNSSSYPNPPDYQSPTDRDSSIEVREIARIITSIEENVSLDHATGEEYHNVYNSLIQSHLPRLEAIKAVSYNSDRKTVHPENNLLAIAVVAGSTTSLSRLFFDSAAAELYSGGVSPTHDSITD